jgi:hypothetical protein
MMSKCKAVSLECVFDAYRHVELGLFSESVFLTMLEKSDLTTEQQLIHPASNFQRPDSGVNTNRDIHRTAMSTGKVIMYASTFDTFHFS